MANRFKEANEAQIHYNGTEPRTFIFDHDVVIDGVQVEKNTPVNISVNSFITVTKQDIATTSNIWMEEL